MFDVDRLNEALTSNDESAERDEVLEDAARMMVAGQPLWWCEEHGSIPPDLTPDFCQVWHLLDGDVERTCRMVEGWWMPTGKDET